jgi:hypothetical protein
VGRAVTEEQREGDLMLQQVVELGTGQQAKPAVTARQEDRHSQKIDQRTGGYSNGLCGFRRFRAGSL